MEPEKKERKERESRKDDKTPSTKKGAFIDVAKSSYEPGKVHEISFKRMESDASRKSGLHSRKVIRIYRTRLKVVIFPNIIIQKHLGITLVVSIQIGT